MNLHAYQYDFAICAVFQNEARYMKEWIEYHKIVGAQHFYLYNNDSQDNYLKVLQPYIDDGSLELIDWHVPDFQNSGQQCAYLDIINKTKESVKWLAIIDLDEYLVPKSHDTIPAWLADYEREGIGGIGVNWQMFGTSFVPEIGKNQLLTEKLTLKAFETHSENIHIKSIVRPKYVVEPPHIHHFDYQEGYVQINPNDEPFSGPFSPYIATDKIQINHYWTKDEKFLYETKIPRRQGWGETIGSIENRVNALNQIEDTSIARFLPLLRQQMFPAEGWEEFKPITVLGDLKKNDVKDAHFLQKNHLDLTNPRETLFFEHKTSLINGNQLIAEINEQGEELLPLEDPYLNASEQNRIANPFTWFMVAIAALGAFYVVHCYTRVQRVASETPH